MREARDAAHYHFLLEFCHTHPGSHEKKSPHWRQELLVDLDRDGLARDRPLPADFDALLASRERFGVKVGLENIAALAERLGIDTRRPDVILVGGTNGKGTVATALGEAFARAGYRPGVYTSPHVERFLERIQVSGADPDEPALEGACHAVREAVGALDAEGRHPTYFETATALAFEAFTRQRASPWILEVGMGGRGDAVNVMEPIASVITNVGSDHADVLGPTVADRAREKAGILRPGVPAFTAAHGDALSALRREAIARGTPLRPVVADGEPTAPDAAAAALVRAVLGHPEVVRRFPRLEGNEDLIVPLPRLPGRRERFRSPGGRSVLLDVGHNLEAFGALAAALDAERAPGGGRVLLAGLVHGKDASGLAALARGRFGAVYLTRPEGPRGRAARDLAAELAAAGAVVAGSEDDPVAALTAALRATPEGGELVVAGSFYLIGPVRPLVRRMARRV